MSANTQKSRVQSSVGHTRLSMPGCFSDRFQSCCVCYLQVRLLSGSLAEDSPCVWLPFVHCLTTFALHALWIAEIAHRRKAFLHPVCKP